MGNQLSNAISAQILPIEPEDQHQLIHRVPVNGSSMVVRFFSKAGADIQLKAKFQLSEIRPFTLPFNRRNLC